MQDYNLNVVKIETDYYAVVRKKRSILCRIKHITTGICGTR